MLLIEFLNRNPVKSRLLKLAAGRICEHCGNDFPLVLLVVHVINQTTVADPESIDLQREVLVLCPGCHRLFHSKPIAEVIQRELARYRPRTVKNAMRTVLGVPPRTYVPPQTT